jgi:hypothetical protein
MEQEGLRSFFLVPKHILLSTFPRIGSNGDMLKDADLESLIVIAADRTKLAFIPP